MHHYSKSFRGFSPYSHQTKQSYWHLHFLTWTRSKTKNVREANWVDNSMITWVSCTSDGDYGAEHIGFFLVLQCLPSGIIYMTCLNLFLLCKNCKKGFFRQVWCLKELLKGFLCCRLCSLLHLCWEAFLLKSLFWFCQSKRVPSLNPREWKIGHIWAANAKL